MTDVISPLDGKYRNQLEELIPLFSEEAFNSYRVYAECQYLVLISELKLKRLRKLSVAEKKILRKLHILSEEDAQLIKQIETKGYKSIPATNHDVKAIEYYIKLKLSETSLKDISEWVHFGLTSEDINSTAYAVMIGKAVHQVLIPELTLLKTELQKWIQKYRLCVMLGRTHGQPASPTTFGKEIKVFKQRIEQEMSNLTNSKIYLKVNGATGNYNALKLAYPSQDWIEFSHKYAKRISTDMGIKIEANLYTTQIESHDYLVSLFDVLRRLNTILIGFNQDMWRYISDDYITQIPVSGEVGSSTMPHKVNPINFENSEGNLGIANALFDFFRSKLLISRLQRDLSDSTVLRNVGVAFGHSLVAYKSLCKGLSKTQLNEHKLLEKLNENQQVLTEAYQTILRREGIEMPYEQLRELSRGKNVTLAELHKFLKKLPVSQRVKKELLSLRASDYTGLAQELCK